MRISLQPSHTDRVTRTVQNPEAIRRRNQANRKPTNSEDFLLKDYELKVRFLSDHLQRMWMRFNFHLTVEPALTGGKLLVKERQPTGETTTEEQSK